MESLPFIDEHAQRTDAERSAVWSALLETLRGMSGSAALARVLGCDPIEGTSELTGKPGDAVPGFRILDAEPGKKLTLVGRHRFSRYALTFVLDDGRIRALTNATFPGVLGKLYRAAVIGSGGHALITRGMLRKVARASRHAS